MWPGLGAEVQSIDKKNESLLTLAAQIFSIGENNQPMAIFARRPAVFFRYRHQPAVTSRRCT